MGAAPLRGKLLMKLAQAGADGGGKFGHADAAGECGNLLSGDGTGLSSMVRHGGFSLKLAEDETGKLFAAGMFGPLLRPERAQKLWPVGGGCLQHAADVGQRQPQTAQASNQAGVRQLRG